MPSASQHDIVPCWLMCSVMLVDMLVDMRMSPAYKMPWWAFFEARHETQCWSAGLDDTRTPRP
jgi:hypothetical protein